jgi:HPt (histidine-containing phosphotransfer) domain-containing protein
MPRQRIEARILPAKESLLFEGAPEGGLMNANELMEKLGLSEEEMAELVALFMDSCRKDLKQMSNALAAEDARGVSETAHSIKGASGNMRFERVYEIAKIIEEDARQGNLGSIQSRIDQIRTTIEHIEQDFKTFSG